MTDSCLLFTPFFSELGWDKGDNKAPDALESGLMLWETFLFDFRVLFHISFPRKFLAWSNAAFICSLFCQLFTFLYPLKVIYVIFFVF